MALVNTKRACAKCSKSGGTAMCHGCEQSFCTKHFIEHRQELSQQMDNIGQEHDVLRRDLTNERVTHPLLARINQWEQESIIKIQVTAEAARADLQQLINETKTDLKKSADKMTETLQTSRESDDYTEMDIKKWTDELQKLRQMLDNPKTIGISYETDTRSTIRLIKVNDQQGSKNSYKELQLHQSSSQIFGNSEISISERFAETLGKIVLSEGGLVATCTGVPKDESCVDGVARYSSGVHHIGFRVEKRSPGYSIFFGIVNVLGATAHTWHTASLYGWWDLDYRIVGGKMQCDDEEEYIVTDDEMTMTVDCNNRRLQLKHHRLNRLVEIPIVLWKCPFPWKITVLLRNKGDCVRILH